MYTEWVNFRKEVAALSDENQVKYSPETGIFESVKIHWPEGCNSIVEVAIYMGQERVLPYDTEGEGIALNNATQEFPIGLPIKEGEPITLRVINHDSSNSHTITAIASVSGMKYEMGLETAKG